MKHFSISNYWIPLMQTRMMFSSNHTAPDINLCHMINKLKEHPQGTISTGGKIHNFQFHEIVVSSLS